MIKDSLLGSPEDVAKSNEAKSKKTKRQIQLMLKTTLTPTVMKLVLLEWCSMCPYMLNG